MGFADSVTIITIMRFLRDDGKWVTFRGEYAACTNYEILDMSVLGRDILNLFAVIVHRAANVVTMIGESHTLYDPAAVVLTATIQKVMAVYIVSTPRRGLFCRCTRNSN